MKTPDANEKKFRSQLLKGSLELAVLLVLRAADRYGLEIVEVLNRGGGLTVSEGSIYPLLNRLRKDSRVESRWVERNKGHALKYYALTATGQQACEAMLRNFRAHVQAIEAIVEEGQ